MFEIAFKMFDLNGDGDVVFEEYEKVHISELTYLSHLLVDHWLSVLETMITNFIKKRQAVCATFAGVYDTLKLANKRTRGNPYKRDVSGCRCYHCAMIGKCSMAQLELITKKSQCRYLGES